MINLLRFLLKYSGALLFVVFEIIAVMLLLRYNAPQREKFSGFTGELTAGLVERYQSATAYLRLRDMNENLVRENTYLINEVAELRSAAATTSGIQQQKSPARVLSNQVTGRYNRILLDKGEDDGVLPGMGIMSADGHPIGIIDGVTQNYASAMSMLNMNFLLSVAVQNTSYFGLMQWQPPNVFSSRIKDLPAHAKIAVGDTIITSGYSLVFERGLHVGTITAIQRPKGQGTLLVDVRLLEDLANLDHIYYAETPDLEQLDSLIHPN